MKSRDGQQFEMVVENPGLDINSMAYVHDKIILAAGEKCVFTIQDEQLVNLRNIFNAVQVSGSGNQAVFIRPEKETEDMITVAYDIYSDSPIRPWYGYHFEFDK